MARDADARRSDRQSVVLLAVSTLASLVATVVFVTASRTAWGPWVAWGCIGVWVLVNVLQWLPVRAARREASDTPGPADAAR